MRFATNPRFIITVFGLAAAIALGCGGGSNGPTGTPTASVDGYWVITSINNAGFATLTGCTGDLVTLNGLTLGSIGGAGCVESEWQYTSQSGSAYTSHPIGYACDSGDFGTRSGGGTVDGNQLQGIMNYASGFYGYTEAEHYSGTKTGSDTLTLSLSRITATGSLVGSCNIVPPLSGNIWISPTPPATARPAGAPGFGVGDLGRFLRREAGSP